MELNKIYEDQNINAIVIASPAITHKDLAIEALKNNKTFVIGVEGSIDSGWVLIDCGQIVINIMKKEERDFYDLEGLWGENSFIEQSS